MGPKEDPRKAELESGRLGLPPNQSLVSASEVAPTTNAADEVALAVKRAKGGVLQMARVTSEVVMLPLLPVAGRRNGVSVPLHACEHYYLVTEPVAGLPAELPVLRSYCDGTYWKEGDDVAT